MRWRVEALMPHDSGIAGEATYAGARRAPRAGSPACVSVFVLIYVEFEFSESTRRPPTRKKNGAPTSYAKQIGKKVCLKR